MKKKMAVIIICVLVVLCAITIYEMIYLAKIFGEQMAERNANSTADAFVQNLEESDANLPDNTPPGIILSNEDVPLSSQLSQLVETNAEENTPIAKDPITQIKAKAKETQLKGWVYNYARKINQNPELPRGCEVTSLAMLLNSIAIKAG